MQQTTIERKQEAKKVYEAPVVIYEGHITTRAGSPLGKPDGEGVDPADLFGND